MKFHPEKFTQRKIDLYRSRCAFTDREAAIFEGRLAGKTNVQLSFEMHICTSTISKHVRGIMDKIEAVDKEDTDE